jgi:hypothetical protein
MNRQHFVRSFSALSVAAAVPVMLRRPASAQVATVWDPANYGKAVEELLQLGIISKDTAQGVSNALSFYNEYLRQGKVTIQSIWPIIQPYLQDLNKVTNWAIMMPSKAQGLNQTFSSEFGDYVPDQNYGDQWDFAKAKARRAIQSTLKMAQVLQPRLQNESLTVQKLVNQPVNTQADLLQLNANLAAEMNRQLIEQREEFSNQSVSQAQYMTALLNQQEATRRNPGTQRVLTTLQDVATQLNAKSKPGG